MKNFGRRSLLWMLAALAGVLSLSVTQAQLRFPRESQKANLMQTVGITDVTIVYSRPGVKGRKIWGAKDPDPKAKEQPLVPYGEVWRSGADEATTFTVTDDVTINGQKLPAGAYSLHTIPGEKEWIVIFNKVDKQWGSFTYKAEQDALRITAMPEAAPMQEWLIYQVSDATKSSARIALCWEKLSIPFTVAVPDLEGLVLSKARAAVANAKPDDWNTPYQAANYYLAQAKTNQEEAWKWLQKSVSIKETFQNLGLMARGYAAMGKTDQAIAAGEKAVQVGKSATPQANTAALERLLAEWKAKKPASVTP